MLRITGRAVPTRTSVRCCVRQRAVSQTDARSGKELIGCGAFLTWQTTRQRVIVSWADCIVDSVCGSLSTAYTVFATPVRSICCNIIRFTFASISVAPTRARDLQAPSFVTGPTCDLRDPDSHTPSPATHPCPRYINISTSECPALRERCSLSWPRRRLSLAMARAHRLVRTETTAATVRNGR